MIIIAGRVNKQLFANRFTTSAENVIKYYCFVLNLFPPKLPKAPGTEDGSGSREPERRFATAVDDSSVSTDHPSLLCGHGNHRNHTEGNNTRTAFLLTSEFCSSSAGKRRGRASGQHRLKIILALSVLNMLLSPAAAGASSRIKDNNNNIHVPEVPDSRAEKLPNFNLRFKVPLAAP